MRVHNFAKTVVCLLVVLLICSCEAKAPALLQVINDFESEASLDMLFWKCRTVFTRSRTFVSYGEFGVKVEMYPDAYPGFGFPTVAPRLVLKGTRLVFDTFNPQPEKISLHYRIDDRPEAPYGDRVDGTLSIPSGKGQVVLVLDALKTSRTKRLLDLSGVERVLFFLISPKTVTTLYIDYLRLEASNNRN